MLAALRAGPLVTLTGVGGAGKSRLALEVAARDRARFADGVWLCELAALPDGSPVGHAVAAALKIQQRSGRSIEQTVIEYLRGRRLLLVVDNCEHVLAPAARLVAEIVQRCPEVAVLATSREALGVDGEQLWPVPPLGAEDATALFVQRARAATPDFRLDRDAAEAVAAICARLDGLPLGIELAAARMRVMSPMEVARRLADAPLLGGGRGPVARHQSLVAAIDWSYRLLPEPERRLFDRMSVFAGGADLRGVHRVADPAATEDDVLDRLTRLVDRSLVVATPGVHSRYRLLETLRAYGRSRTEADGLDDGAGPPARRLLRRAGRAGRARAAGRGRAGLGGRGAGRLRQPARRVPAGRRRPGQRPGRPAGRGHARAGAPARRVRGLRVGRAGAASTRTRTIRSTSPRSAPPRAGRGTAASSRWPGSWPGGRRAGCRRRGPRASPTRATCSPTWRSTRATSTWRCGTTRPRRQRARPDGRTDPAGLDALLRGGVPGGAPRAGAGRRCRAGEPGRGRVDGQPDRAVDGPLRAGPGAARSPSPDRALALFDEASRLAAAVRNFWWQGIAMMEAAATRAVHGDPAAAAGAFLAVLDHWDRVGDSTQQWLNLRYVARLLQRAGRRGGRGRAARVPHRRGQTVPARSRPARHGPRAAAGPGRSRPPRSRTPGRRWPGSR